MQANDRREWQVYKSKDGEDGAVHPFLLEVVEVGTDDDGEPITSCIVAPAEAASDSVRRVLPSKSGNQRIIWEALGEVFRNSTTFTQAGAPPFKPCVLLEDAIDKVDRKSVV